MTIDIRIDPAVTDSDDLFQGQTLLDGADEGPELEWCPDCSLGDDPQAEPGMAQVVLDRSIESDSSWGPTLGRGPEYAVTYLACGHTLAELC